MLERCELSLIAAKSFAAAQVCVDPRPIPFYWQPRSSVIRETLSKIPFRPSGMTRADSMGLEQGKGDNCQRHYRAGRNHTDKPNHRSQYSTHRYCTIKDAECFLRFPTPTALSTSSVTFMILDKNRNRPGLRRAALHSLRYDHSLAVMDTPGYQSMPQ